MADTLSTETSKAAQSTAPTIKVVLTGRKTYVYGDNFFYKDQPQTVDAELAEYLLSRTMVETVTKPGKDPEAREVPIFEEVETKSAPKR